MARDIFCPAWAMPETDYSARDDSLAEPLSGIQPLLVGCIYDPLLILRISYFAIYSFEPVRSLAGIADSPPQLADQIGKDSALFPRYGIVGS
jgi:hypothetical protein